MNLREFSEILGLSPTTVSRALGGYPEVSEETRRLVERAALQHGYRPNRRAAALASGRAMAIGHVIPTAMGHEMVNPVFADFVAGAGEVYSSAGYDLTMSVVPDGDELRAYRQMISARSVDGIIVHGPRLDDPRIALLREADMPFVVHGRVPGEPLDYPFVDVANTRAFYRATSDLMELGHRRIALINGLEHLDFALRRRAGWEAALRDGGLTVDPDLGRAGVMSEQNGADFTRALLAERRPPTAILVSSLIMAVGVRRALHEAGLELGRDLSVVCHDDMLGYLGNAGTPPIFTATCSSVRAAGRRCAEILLRRIASPDAPAEQEIWPCDVVRGASTGPAPRATGAAPPSPGSAADVRLIRGRNGSRAER